MIRFVKMKMVFHFKFIVSLHSLFSLKSSGRNCELRFSDNNCRNSAHCKRAKLAKNDLRCNVSNNVRIVWIWIWLSWHVFDVIDSFAEILI